MASTIDFDKLTSGVTGAPTTWDDQCCEVVLDGVNDKFAESDVFTPLARGFARYEVIIGAEGLADNQQFMIGWLKAEGASPIHDLILIELRQASGQLIWRHRVAADTAGTWVNYDSSTTVQLGTPCRLEYKWDTTNSLWEIRQDDTTLHSGALSGSAASAQLDTLGLGAWTDFNRTATYYLDNIAAQADAWIGSETPGPPPSTWLTKHAYARRFAVAAV